MKNSILYAWKQTKAAAKPVAQQVKPRQTVIVPSSMKELSFKINEDTSISADYSVDWPFNGGFIYNEIEPREVQLRALAKAKGKKGFAYFIRQRLGKTWTAFAEFINLKEANEVDWMIVICPNSLKTQWVEAIEQAAPAIPVHYYNSQTKINTDHFLKHAESGVFIINYESVKSFVESGGTQKINLSRTFIVADESTKIKDPSSKAAKACIMLADMCAYQRILTGKPTANSNADVWSQLRFIQATNRNFTQHRYMFCQMGGWQDKTFVENQNTSVLQEEMMPYCYIAEDKYITDFKKVYEPMREIKLLPEQKETYDQMQSNLILELREGIKISAPIVLVKYLRLQQITSGIAGDIDGEQHNVIKPENNPKIQGVLDIINNECTNKVIVVCRFRLSVDNVYEVLTKNGYKCVKLIGGMSNEDLTNVKKDFNEGDAQIMVAQIQVLSYGHTLCATDEKPCDSVIFFENNFSLIDRAQSESRPEKYGRNVAISIYDFFASNMDRYMINSLIRKEEGSLSLMNYAREYGILNR